MRITIWLALAVGGLAALSYAVQTRSWSQDEAADFEKGVIKNLSLRSDGRLSLAPRFQERFNSSSAYLWALAQDSKGNLYTGGGPGAKLYRINPKGYSKTVAELDGLEIHAIAIDSKDNVFAATSPDGKVYRLSDSGKPEVYYDPKTKYIWAMELGAKGELFVATGDQGDIHKVTAAGKGSVFFRTEETHARSLAIDSSGNLIVGTDPGGLVYRVSPSGDGFVLYQMAKKEVTAVAVAKDGSLYAAGVGNKAPSTGTPSPLSPPPAAVVPPPVAGQTRTPMAPPATFVPSAAAPISGGSEVYRISPDGAPSKVWSHPQDVVYSIALDADGRAILGSGNKGVIYRIDSPILSTALLSSPPTQITCLESTRDGRIFAASGNVGKVYEIGPGVEPEGSVESQVFDAGSFSQWGRLSILTTPDGSLSVVTRSGNLDRPQRNWSPWSPPLTGDGGRITSPAARFLQWKATLKAGATGQSPVLESIETAYLPANVAPRVDIIEATPPNYRFPAPSSLLTPPQQTLNLPPLGRRSQSSSSPVQLDTGASTMQYAKGHIGARWSATDDNGDPLVFKVLIRGDKETEWKLLRDKVREKHVSWDSTAYPDGEYRLRVIASDSPGNPKESALTGELESDPFLIDNTPPRISGLAANWSAGKLQVRWKAADALNIIVQGQYSIDGGDWTLVLPTSRLSDSRELDYELSLDGIAPGEHTVAVRVQDYYDNTATEKVIVTAPK